MYLQLSAFAKENGHCKVPRGRGLGEWMTTQRKEKKKCLEGKKLSLTDARIEKLDTLPFEWNLNDWDKNCELLAQEIKSVDCYVPKQTTTLGRWALYQRKLYKTSVDGKSSSMTKEKIEKLESIGFQLDG
ncbi:hypothetical protein ACHAWF_000230 [Thalassiosira exigua]